MTRHPVLFWACGFLFGIWFGLSPGVVAPALALLCFLSGLIPMLRHGNDTATAVAPGKHLLYNRLPVLLWSLLFFGCFGLGLCASAKASASYRNLISAVDDGDTVSLTGEVTRLQEKEAGLQITLKNCSLTENEKYYRTKGLLIYLDPADLSADIAEEILPGARLCLRGQVIYFDEARNFGNFDCQKYYLSLGIPFAVKAASLSLEGKAGWIQRLLFDFSSALRQVYEKYLSQRQAGTLCAMLLGDKSELDSEIKSLYQRAGISHVLAVSGLHVSLVGMSLYRFLRKRRLSLKAAGVLSACMALCFLSMTGCGISTLRAVGCFLLVLLARTWGRSSDTFTSLGIMAAFILAQNPYALTNSAFQMSFGAMVGMSLLTATDLGHDWDREAPKKGILPLAGEKLTGQLKCSGGIFLATAPMTLFSGGTIPIYSFILNLFVIPLMTPLVLCGFGGGILGLLLPGATPLLRIAFLPSKWILTFYDLICRLSLKLPFAELIVGKPTKLRILIYYLLFALLYFVWLRIKERRDDREKKSRGAGRYLVYVLPAALLMLFLCFHMDLRFHVDFLDVGQGDAALIHTASGRVIFVDGGSTDVTSVGTYRILPCLKAMGYDHVDDWIITHGDEDHYNGIGEILESGYRIDCLILSEISYEDGNLAELLALAEENDTEIKLAGQGAVLREERAGEQLELNFIWPVKGTVFSDKNQGCLSFLMTYRNQDFGFKGLFCGDLPEETEEALLDDPYAGPLLREGVFLYKCNHHGSAYSSGPIFLEAISPSVTVISVGADNSYGHPAPETLARLETIGSDVYKTMDYGQITLQYRQKNLYLFTFLGKAP